MIRRLRAAAILVLCLVAVLVVGAAAPAAAHNVTAGADLRIAQTIAGAEVTVVIKGTPRVPGPLRIGVVAYQPVAALPVGLEVRSVEDGRTVTGTARAAARDPQYARLQVERTGPHELKLSAGNEVAVIPFRVLVDRGSAGDFLIYGGLFVAGLLLAGGLLTGAPARRGAAMLLAAGAAAGVTVAVMVIVFEPWIPPPLPDGAAPEASSSGAGVAAGGRPYAQARVATVPARPEAGEEFTLRIDLVDGSTGRPVDDLTVHHEALAHVVLTSEDGRYFRHLHPLRTAPGRLEVRMRADRPGRYLTHTELERENSGGQLTSATVTVGGEAPAPETQSSDPATSDPATSDPATSDPATSDPATSDPATSDPATSDPATPEPATPDPTVTDPAATSAPVATDSVAEDPAGAGAGGVGAVPRLRPGSPVAGRPATIELDTPAGVRPWLGMAGHLLIRSQDGAFFGHVHEMGTPGSRLRFTFSFPQAGRYLAWAQYATGEGVVTVPFAVDVTASEATR
ncbi:hypothetical protein OIE67_25455 [Nonomuraea fuscirosea]|uniref:hypothetical protein n=1 Tax=Nonomuraea fuscirosea TaxID=1291556 RepID=UPI002DDBCF62|nr:hypothetical protein [Nonomuraea fuscirosea]WSA57843.1 hypothetical protein OIE67_25455 [Nonomuraea fuscirosea]